MLQRTLLATSLLLACACTLTAADTRAPDKEEDLVKALKKARVNGKYQMLLHQFKLADDQKTVGDFKDVGYQRKAEYKGVKNLPGGHWVYVAPYWYIWRDEVAKVKAKRPWGPEQVADKPDVPQAGDNGNAWASLSQDGQDEWLTIEYEEPILVKEVEVHENLAPGALYKVTAYKLDGEEVEVWKGQDPTKTDEASGISVVPFKGDFKTNRVRIWLKSTEVPNWNEIDAVGIRDKDKKTHWGKAAAASSTYAQTNNVAAEREDRIKQLEKEVADLKATIKRLEDLLDKLDKEKK